MEKTILASSFGAPETFRAPQNTTCYVRLNINFRYRKLFKLRTFLVIKSYWEVLLIINIVCLVINKTNKQTNTQSILTVLITDCVTIWSHANSNSITQLFNLYHMERSDFTNVFISLCNMSTVDDTECQSWGMHCFLSLLSIKH